MSAAAVHGAGRPAPSGLALAAAGLEPVAARPAWLAGLVSRMVDSGRASAVAALVGGADAVLAAARAGDAASRAEPLFDLASLTKLWTASLALRLDAEGRLPLDLPVGELWARCDGRLAGRRLEDLLRHRAGFRAWTPLYRRCRTLRGVERLLTGGAVLGARRGTYSDLDYALWGLGAERALGAPLAELYRRHLAGPLGLAARRAGRRPGAAWLPCRLGNEREVALAAEQGIRVAPRAGPAAGRPQDGNARFLGGLGAHAGLFGSAAALWRLAREWLRPGALWPSAAARAALAGPGPFALGWRRASRRGSAGPALGPDARGHVGFTGGSLWIDPGAGRILILLAHRRAVDVDLAPDRRRFHARAATW